MTTAWVITTIMMGTAFADHSIYFTSEVECQKVLKMIATSNEENGENKKLIKPPPKICTNVFIKSSVTVIEK